MFTKAALYRLAVLFAACLSSCFLRAQSISAVAPSFQPVCPNPNSLAAAQNGLKQSASPQVSCNPQGGGGGGGGAPAPNYSLNWSSPYTTGHISVGGTLDRVGVGATVFNNTMFVSYTGRKCTAIANPIPNGPTCLVQPGGGGPIFFSTATDQNPSAPQSISLSGATLSSGSNTSVAVFNNQLYYVAEDNSGNLFWLHSVDGVNWGNAERYCMGGVGGGVSLVVYHNLLYAAVNKGNQLAICKIDASDNSTVIYPSTVPFNMAPGIGILNDTLFVGFQPTDNSHNITLYTSTDGVNFNLNLGAAADQTSTTPSFVVHKGVFYLGFRTNDGDHKFLYKYSLDGTNYLGTGDPHFTMGGPPHLMEYNGILYNWFSQNDTDQLLYSSIAQ